MLFYCLQLGSLVDGFRISISKARKVLSFLRLKHCKQTTEEFEIKFEKTILVFRMLKIFKKEKHFFKALNAKASIWTQSKLESTGKGLKK